jgi:hypothetical protein
MNSVQIDYSHRWPDQEYQALVVEIDRLRAGLRAIIVADQIAGAAPPHVTLRRLPEYNVETWDGPHAALARRILEQKVTKL